MEITGMTLRGSNSGFHAVPRSLGGGGGGGCGKANVRSSKNAITVGSSSSTKTARKTHRSSHESKSDYATRTRDARRCDGEEVRCRAEEKYQKPRRQEAKSASRASVSTAKPVRMSRAQGWSMLVEDNHRFQCGGWRDEREYAAEHGSPERWDNGFIKCVRVKKNGYFTYWRNYRECEEKLVHMVKLYEY